MFINTLLPPASYSNHRCLYKVKVFTFLYDPNNT